MKRHITLTFACAVLCAVAGSAFADNLVPGSSVLTTGTAGIPGTLLATVTAPVTGLNALGENRFNGFLTAQVIQEEGGTLDFWYQFANDQASSDGVERLSMTDFTGFATDVNWINDNTGTVSSSYADRGIDGAKISFDFIPTPLGSGLILPGSTTDWVVIKTDAKFYTTGTTSVIDGGVASVQTFAPTAVPEPASLAALGIGFAGFLRRRRVTRR